MKFSAIALICIYIYIFPIAVLGEDTPADSRLRELALQYEKVAYRNNMELELAALEPFLEEAIRQGNVKEEQYARISKVYCYFNFDRYDLLYDEIDRQMEYFSSRGWWEKYYACASLRIEALVFQNKPISALREADRQYAEAQNARHPQAIVTAAYNLFFCYHYSGRNEEAARIFEEEILANKQNIPSGSEGNYYSLYSDVLYSLKRYDDLLKHAAAYEELLNENYKLHFESDSASNTSVHRFYVAQSYADAYSGLGEIDKAEFYYKQALEMDGDRSKDRIAMMGVHARILKAKKQYDEALAEIDRAINDPEASVNQSVRNSYLSLKAEILHEAGYFAESSALYREVVALIDSIYSADQAVQINDLRSIYEFDRLTSEKERVYSHLLIALLVCGAMAITISLYIVYSRRLRIKNKMLVDRIQEKIRYEQERRDAQTATPDAGSKPVAENYVPITSEPELFRRFRDLLIKEKLHLTSELNRDMLLNRLGTNKNKLSEVVFSVTGRSLMEYIMDLRLQEALLLMESHPDLPFSQIAEQTGFGAYSSFYRAFYKQYGVKPTDYRIYRKK